MCCANIVMKIIATEWIKNFAEKPKTNLSIVSDFASLSLAEMVEAMSFGLLV